MTRCQRCGRETVATTMSWFNKQIICALGDDCCDEVESRHPDYSKAKDAESSQVILGNSNYEGIGLPASLETDYMRRST